MSKCPSRYEQYLHKPELASHCWLVQTTDSGQCTYLKYGDDMCFCHWEHCPNISPNWKPRWYIDRGMKHPKCLEEFLVLNDHKWVAIFSDSLSDLESEVLMSISKLSNKLHHGLQLWVSCLRRFTFTNVTFKIACRVIFGLAHPSDWGASDPHVRGVSNKLMYIHIPFTCKCVDQLSTFTYILTILH